jgi:hypothetical protein
LTAQNSETFNFFQGEREWFQKEIFVPFKEYDAIRATVKSYGVTAPMLFRTLNDYVRAYATLG